VAEWFKAAVLKTAVVERLPGVRIPPHPLKPKKTPEKPGVAAKGEGKGEGFSQEVAELAQALAALPPEMRAALLALAKGK
jgi:DNA-directed RNA polymerase specialized sigma24 family protein